MNLQKIILICASILLTIIPISGLADVEIRKITPPRLDNAHLGKKILCHRPMRYGSPNMSIEYKENKLIAHNYGHGENG